MRVAVATLSHETNTFTTDQTTLADFETATGDRLLADFTAARSLPGIVERLREAGVDIQPTVGAATIPSGTVGAEAFEWMGTELVDRLDADLDGVCLDLHGSMFVVDEPDPEGAVLRDVRDVVGPDVPVVAALDMHATITDRMVRHLDGVAGYRTAPHTDVVETGQSKTQRDRIQNIKGIISDIEDEYDEGAPADVVIERAEEVGIDESKAEHEIDKLKQKGEVYEPRTDHIRTT